jgi:hypothetical protein
MMMAVLKMVIITNGDGNNGDCDEIHASQKFFPTDYTLNHNNHGLQVTLSTKNICSYNYVVFFFFFIVIELQK